MTGEQAQRKAEKEAGEEFLKVYMFENFAGLDEITL